MNKTLYKQNNTGKIQQWSVSANDNTVTTVFGQFQGKLQTTSEVVTGKNIGKVNETTDNEQALLKAQQLYDAKLKKGYTPDLELARSTTNTLDAVNPMLAFPIEKKEKYVTFPAYVQPKLDGMRCIAVVENGTCTLYTRTQKVISTLPHINEEIENVAEQCGHPNIILDGELYNHALKEDFNRLMSLIKRDEPHEDCKEIEYHMYDVVSSANYSERTEPLQDFHMEKHLMAVGWVEISSRELIETTFQDFLNAGYEGAMYRNPNMGYEHKRSTSLLKVKVMDDAEFTIVDVNEGKGKLAGHAGAFVCVTNGNEFKAKLKGKTEDLKEYLVNKDKYIGKQLTVQFQGLTPDDIPRFPVGLRIREEE